MLKYTAGDGNYVGARADMDGKPGDSSPGGPEVSVTKGKAMDYNWIWHAPSSN